MLIRSTAPTDLKEIRDFVVSEGCWLDEQAVVMAVTLGGIWSRVLVDDSGVIEGVLLAGYGYPAADSEPEVDDDAEANYTEGGQFITDVDSDAQLVMLEPMSPEFGQETSLIIWDVVGGHRAVELLLRNVINESCEFGLNCITWIDRTETESWVDQMLRSVFPYAGGGLMQGHGLIDGLGQVGYWVGFGTVSPFGH